MPDTNSSLLSHLILFVAILFWMGIAVWALVQRWKAVSARRRAVREAGFWRSLFDAAPGGCLLLDINGRCLLSDKARTLLGLGDIEIDLLDDLVGENAAHCLPSHIRGQLKALIEGSMTAPAILEFPQAPTLRLFEVKEYEASEDQSGARLFWIEDISKEHALYREAMDRDISSRRVIRRLKGVIDHAPIPIWLRGKNLDLILANPAYIKAVERTSEDEVLIRQTEIVENALTGSSRDCAKRAKEAAKTIEERHFAVIQGERRALAITDVSFDDHVAGYAIDVTEAEEKRAELARLIDGHAETLNKLSSPVAIFDTDQRLRFYNRAFSHLFSLGDDWLAEQPDHASLLERMREKRRLPEQADFRAWKAEELALHQKADPVEEMWHLPDGSTLRMVAQPHPLGGLVLIFEDVTDRLALESSYNTLIAVQRETLNNLHEAVAVFGSDGRLKLYNPNYALIWTLEASFLDGAPHFSDVLDKAKHLVHSSGEWQAFKDQLLAQIHDRRTYSGRWHRPDDCVLDYTIVPLPDGRTLITYLDVTDSFRIENALLERNEALETADRLKSEFVANMSYELRTPLNSIIGFTEMLSAELHGPLVEKQQTYLKYVLGAAADLRDLIDDILDLAVIEAGAMELEFKKVAVKDLVESSVALGRDQARKSGLKLGTKIQDDIGEIEGDPRRLKQAIYNLVGNAIKYTPRGGKVEIEARAKSDGFIEIEVRDTGQGISDEDKDDVFKKFNTGSGPHGRKGAGLGLSLVQSFIELHNGSITLESRPRKGTTVICVLPRSQAHSNKVRKAG